MSKKHFVLLARTILETRPPQTSRARYAQWKAGVDAQVSALATTNPRFDASRFRRACGDE